jgi:hypothetical protein
VRDARVTGGSTEAPEAQPSAKLITHAATQRMISTWQYGDLIGNFARLKYRGSRSFVLTAARRRDEKMDYMRLGRMLIIIGLFVLALGLIVSIGERLPIRLGRLPGDIIIRGKNSVFYFPIVTSLLISVILSVILWLFGRR